MNLRCLFGVIGLIFSSALFAQIELVVKIEDKSAWWGHRYLHGTVEFDPFAPKWILDGAGKARGPINCSATVVGYGEMPYRGRRNERPPQEITYDFGYAFSQGGMIAKIRRETYLLVGGDPIRAMFELWRRSGDPQFIPTVRPLKISIEGEIVTLPTRRTGDPSPFFSKAIRVNKLGIIYVPGAYGG